MRIPALPFVAACVALALPVAASAAALELTATEAASPAALVPAGWHVESRHQGDLDGDGVGDLVLVLQHAEHEGTRDRALLVVAHHGKVWKVLASNLGLLPCAGCAGVKGGDAAPGVTIERRVLTISLAGGSREWWSSVLRFRIEKRTGHLDLIGRDDSTGDSWTGAEHDRSTDYLTGAWVRTDQPPAPDDGGPQPAATVKKGRGPRVPLVPFEAVARPS